MKFQYIEQKHKHGCAVACIAMILGKSYDEVEQTFENDFDKCGIKREITREYICDHSFALVEKSCYSYSDIKKSNERMRQPFAEVHIVSVQVCVDSKNNHSLVMDSKGEIFDPARPGHKEWDYYFVHSVLGFFSEVQEPVTRRGKK